MQTRNHDGFQPIPDTVRGPQEHRWIQRPDGIAGGRHGWTVWPTVYSLPNGGVLRVIQGLGWVGRYAFETWDGSDVCDWTAASVTYYNVGFNASQWGRGRRCSGDR